MLETILTAGATSRNTASGTATTTRRHRFTARQWHSHASLGRLDWRWKEVASGEGRRRQRGGCLRIQPDAVRPAFSLPCSGTGASVTSAPYPFGLKGARRGDALITTCCCVAYRK